RIVMNQYLILVRGNYDSNISPDEAQKRMAVFGEWVQKVLADRYVAGAPLDGSQGRLIRSRTEVLTDGPFLESKEMISGYISGEDGRCSDQVVRVPQYGTRGRYFPGHPASGAGGLDRGIHTRQPRRLADGSRQEEGYQPDPAREAPA